MQQPIVKDLTSKAKARPRPKFIKCPKGQSHGLEDFITAFKSATINICHDRSAEVTSDLWERLITKNYKKFKKYKYFIFNACAESFRA